MKQALKIDLVALSKQCSVDGRSSGMYLPASQVQLDVTEAANQHLSFVAIDPGLVKAIEARVFQLQLPNNNNNNNNDNDTHNVISTKFEMKSIGRSTSFVFDPKKNQHHKDTQQRKQEQATSLNDAREDETVIGTLKASPISTHNQLLINHNRQVPHQYEDVKQLKGIVFDQNMRISVIYFIIFLLFYFYFFFSKIFNIFFFLKAAEERKTRHILKQRSWSKFLRRVINACVTNDDGKRHAIIVLGNGGNFRVRGHHRSLSHQQLAWSLVGLGLIVVGVDEFYTSKVRFIYF